MTIDNIMRGPANYGYEPRNLRWAPDGKHLFFDWKERTEAIEKDFDTWIVDRDGKNLRRLSDDEKKNAPPVNNRAAWTRYPALRPHEARGFERSTHGQDAVCGRTIAAGKSACGFL